MARNIGSTKCVRCGSTPELVEKPRAITKQDCGLHYDDHAGLAVAYAVCPKCKAQYTAWVADIPMFTDPGETIRTPIEGVGFFDLSFRNSFNHIPGFGDLPEWNKQVTLEVPRQVAMSIQFLMAYTSCELVSRYVDDAQEFARHKMMFMEIIGSALGSTVEVPKEPTSVAEPPPFIVNHAGNFQSWIRRKRESKRQSESCCSEHEQTVCSDDTETVGVEFERLELSLMTHAILCYVHELTEQKRSAKDKDTREGLEQDITRLFSLNTKIIDEWNKANGE